VTAFFSRKEEERSNSSINCTWSCFSGSFKWRVSIVALSFYLRTKKKPHAYIIGVQYILALKKSDGNKVY
jgi:hypothetical protein